MRRSAVTVMLVLVMVLGLWTEVDARGKRGWFKRRCCRPCPAAAAAPAGDAARSLPMEYLEETVVTYQIECMCYDSPFPYSIIATSDQSCWDAEAAAREQCAPGVSMECSDCIEQERVVRRPKTLAAPQAVEDATRWQCTYRCVTRCGSHIIAVSRHSDRRTACQRAWQSACTLASTKGGICVCRVKVVKLEEVASAAE